MLINLNENKLSETTYKMKDESPKFFHKVYGATRFLKESVSLSKVYLKYLKKVVKGDKVLKRMKVGTRLKECCKIN